MHFKSKEKCLGNSTEYFSLFCVWKFLKLFAIIIIFILFCTVINLLVKLTIWDFWLADTAVLLGLIN